MKQKLVEAVIANRWWERLKDRIRYLTTEFSQRLVLDKPNKVKVLKGS